MLLFSTTLLFILLYVTKGVDLATVLLPKLILDAQCDLARLTVRPDHASLFLRRIRVGFWHETSSSFGALMI